MENLGRSRTTGGRFRHGTQSIQARHEEGWLVEIRLNKYYVLLGKHKDLFATNFSAYFGSLLAVAMKESALNPTLNPT